MIFIPGFLLVCLAAFVAASRGSARISSPTTDSGQFILHVRAKTGTRIEETARLCDLVEAEIRQEIPPRDLDNILDNIGLPYSGINLTHMTSGVIGAADADIHGLAQARTSTDRQTTSRRSAQELPREFPGVTFYFLPADIVTQILNFGLPAPIDIQIDGADMQAIGQLREPHCSSSCATSRASVDLRIQQHFDYPMFHVDVDRTKAQQGGLIGARRRQQHADTLSGSFQTTPMFFLNWNNGVNYNLVDADAAVRYSVAAGSAEHPDHRTELQHAPAILADVASIERSQEMAAVDHYNIRRVVEHLCATCKGAISAPWAATSRVLSTPTASSCRAAVSSSSAGNLTPCGGPTPACSPGWAFSILFVYLLIVVNFQSWLDPFIIITALPAALAGIVLFLFFTDTTLSVPALMGAIMCMGVATANSILVISFAKERLAEHGDAVRAAIEAGFTRFRPVLMTALAMIIGMVPMALGVGEGGEQNAPLGRAVIGGLLLATVATLCFVPLIFSLMHSKRDGGHAASG